MSRNTALAALACASLMVSGCAAGPRTALKPELRTQIASTQAFAGVKQNEIYAQIIPSTSGQAAAAGMAAIPGLGILLAGVAGAAGGAADAGINASRAKEAEIAVAPLRDGLTDFDFDAALRAELDRTLAGSGLNAQPIEVVKQVEDKHYKELFDKSTSAAVLFVNTDYSMSPDFSAVVISTQGLVFARSPELRKASGLRSDEQALRGAIDVTKAIYRNSYVFESKLQSATTDKAQNIAAWQQDGRVRAALEQGIREVGALVALDLQSAPEPKVDHRRPQSQTKTPAAPADEIVVNGVRGRLLATNGTTRHVRLGDGTLKALAETSTAAAIAAPAAPAEAAPATPAAVSN